jgi:FRG domain
MLMSDFVTASEAQTARGWRDVDEWIWDAGRSGEARQPRAAVAFRGSSLMGDELASSLARRGGEYAGRERYLLRTFRKYAYRHGERGWTDWEWLALARHHGLPTRILDWSFSPLIGLHFATLRHPDEAGTVWAVDYRQVHAELPPPLSRILEEHDALLFTAEMLAEVSSTLDGFDRLGRDADLVVFFEPPSIDDRVLNQLSVFSAMSSATARLDHWLARHPGAARRLVIPPETKAEVRERLDFLGITERVFFPGPGGLAAFLTRYYSGHPLETPSLL